MTDQTQAQQSIPIPPLAVRLTEKDGWWGKIVLAAAKIAVARRNGKDAPADQGRLINEGVQEVKSANRYPMFFGDMVALGLSGLIKHPDPAGQDAIRQITLELAELKKRHGDKPPHAYPPKDAIAFYELMTRLDAGIDSIDNSPACTAIILDRKAGNRVRAFAILRRAVGITRSGHYREGDKLRLSEDFTRINQDGMRTLLQMYGEYMHSQGKPVVSSPDEVVISSEEDQFIGDLARSAAEEKARRSETDEEWAYKTCSLWLAGKEPDDDPGPTGESERINALKDEVKNLTFAVNILKAQVEGTADPDMKAAGQNKLARLRGDLQTKQDDLATLEKPAGNGAKANGTAPRPGDGAPMPSTPRITIMTETGEKSVEEGIAEVTAKLESQRTAAANYAADVERLYAEATGHMMKQEMNEATQKLNQATQAQASATTANEQVIKLEARLTELEELKAEGTQPAEPGKKDELKPKRKVKLSGRKASAAARATAGKTEQSTAAASTEAEETTEQRAERERLATLAASAQPPAEPAVAAPGAVTPDGTKPEIDKLVLIKAIKAKTGKLGDETVKNLLAMIAGGNASEAKEMFEVMTS